MLHVKLEEGKTYFFAGDCARIMSEVRIQLKYVRFLLTQTVKNLIIELVVSEKWICARNLSTTIDIDRISSLCF